MNDLDSNELYHHGILGMKWGVRRYQNPDGTLTEAGKKRYYNDDGTFTKAGRKRIYNTQNLNGSIKDELYNNKNIKAQASRLDAYYIRLKNANKDYAKFPNDETIHKLAEASYKYSSLTHRIVDEMLGEYGHTKINDKMLTYGGQLVQEALRKHVEENYARRGEIKKEFMDKAKRSDQYDIDFLETVQNDPVLGKGGKELLKEYSKYLDDPVKYAHEFDKSDYFKKNPHLDHEDQDEDHLEHWGILGMKWGVRRYQNADGSLTSAGRKRYASGKNVGFFEARRLKKKRAEAAKKRQATLEAKRKVEEDAQKHESEKQEAIRSGNATQISKYQNELSNQELREVLDRLGSKQRLSDMAAKETPKKLSKLDKATNIANKAAQAADIAEKGIKAYNTFAKITNTFADDDSQLPIIGEKKEKRNLSKEEAIKSGDPKILEAWKGKLSKDEVVQAYTIANNWQKIADMKLKPEQKEVLEQAGKAVIDSIASQSSSDKSTSKSETKPVSALDAYEKAYDTRSSYKSFEKEMKPKDDKKEKTSIFKPKEPEKYEYKPSTYDPNERQSALWRSSFNPSESKKQDRAAQQKRVDDLISKYSTSAGSDWNDYQSEQAYKKAKDESHLTAKQIINNILEDEERKRKS